ncbi:exonuclease domain-containing protein [Bacillus salitolerans]|uniref:Exonuclease domain-containing protein n=1 Tax=Bacillus salitolerans TaxID=1437434 RepID=A0ABW4LR78_9BACI
MADVKQFIFFDFEMLCSDQGMSYTEMEAIRLGAVKFNLQTEEISFFDKYIKPENTKPLSKFCKKLTGISDEDLSEAEMFPVVFEEFLTWIGGIKKSRFFSWSASDLNRLKIDAVRHVIPPVTIAKIEARYTDFQAIFTKRVSKTHQSVENALKLYNLSFVGDAHNPMYDAYNTLRIYLNFLNNPLQSDMIMIHQFIQEEIPYSVEQLNKSISKRILDDIRGLSSQLHDIYLMKDALKMVKNVKRLTDKYENIIINRSGVFSDQNIFLSKQIVEFYQNLLFSYEEHFNHCSNIMILDDHLVQPFQHVVYRKEA